MLRTQIPKGGDIADEIVLKDAKSSCRVSAAPSWCLIRRTNTRSSTLADAAARSLELQRNSLGFGTVCQRVIKVAQNWTQARRIATQSSNQKR